MKILHKCPQPSEVVEKKQNELIISNVFYCMNISVANNNEETTKERKKFIERKETMLVEKTLSAKFCRRNFDLWWLDNSNCRMPS